MTSRTRGVLSKIKVLVLDAPGVLEVPASVFYGIARPSSPEKVSKRAGEARKHVSSREDFPFPQDVDVPGRSVHVDGREAWIKEPDGTGAGGQPIVDSLLDRVGRLAGGDDLDGKIRRERPELLRRGPSPHPLFGDERGVGRPDRVGISADKESGIGGADHPEVMGLDEGQQPGPDPHRDDAVLSSGRWRPHHLARNEFRSPIPKVEIEEAFSRQSLSRGHCRRSVGGLLSITSRMAARSSDLGSSCSASC